MHDVSGRVVSDGWHFGARDVADRFYTAGKIQVTNDGSLVPNAPADLALAVNYALDRRAHGEDDFVVANEILGKNRLNGGRLLSP